MAEALLALQGYIFGLIDGVQPEQGHATRSLIRDRLRGRVLATEHLNSSTTGDIETLMDRTSDLQRPLLGVVSAKARLHAVPLEAFRENLRALRAGRDQKDRWQLRRHVLAYLHALEAQWQAVFLKKASEDHHGRYYCRAQGLYHHDGRRAA